VNACKFGFTVAILAIRSGAADAGEAISNTTSGGDTRAINLKISEGGTPRVQTRAINLKISEGGTPRVLIPESLLLEPRVSLRGRFHLLPLHDAAATLRRRWENRSARAPMRRARAPWGADRVRARER